MICPTQNVLFKLFILLFGCHYMGTMGKAAMLCFIFIKCFPNLSRATIS